MNESTPFKVRLVGSVPRRITTVVAAFGLLTLALLILWIWFSAGTDPLIVDGVPFREWVSGKQDFGIRDPLAKLGTNAVPHLIQILHRRPEPAWSFRLKQTVWKHLPRAIQARVAHLRPLPDWPVRRTALFGVRFLGPEAAAALPDVLRIGTTETNLMVRASALVAALNIAPNSPQTFALWRSEWEQTNHFSRADLATYLGMPAVPIPEAVPYLIGELTNGQSQAVQPVVQVFEAFGNAARLALPQMIRLFTGGTRRLDLLRAFERLGPLASEAVPALTACLQEQGAATIQVYDAVQGAQVQVDQRPSLVAGALRALAAIGADAKPALPAIHPFLTNSDPTIRMVAAAAHIRVGGSVEAAMPILLAGLENKLAGVPNVSLRVNIRDESRLGLSGCAARGPEAAAILCGELGAAATNAQPELNRRLEDKSPWLRVAAAQAIWRISHDAKRSLPTLVAALDSVPVPSSPASSSYEQALILVRVLNAMTEMGPAANAAVPSIERVRMFSMAVRHAANRALCSLNHAP